MCVRVYIYTCVFFLLLEWQWCDLWQEYICVYIYTCVYVYVYMYVYSHGRSLCCRLSILYIYIYTYTYIQPRAFIVLQVQHIYIYIVPWPTPLHMLSWRAYVTGCVQHRFSHCLNDSGANCDQSISKRASAAGRCKRRQSHSRLCDVMDDDVIGCVYKIRSSSL